MKRTLARMGGVLVLALLLVLVLASVALADEGTTPRAVDDLGNTAQLLALIGGVVIPFVVALLAKARASLWVKSLLAFLTAGLLALATYLTNTSGSTTWRGAVSVFVIAVVSAAASRYTITGGADTYLNAKTAKFGLG